MYRDRILKIKDTLYVAHVRSNDKKIQTLEEHLIDVAEIAKKLATKINLPEAGELIGLLHDFGKYSTEFQNYLQSATGLIDPDIDNEAVDAKALKGKIDHSSAGAQWIWQELSRYGNNGEGRLCGQIMAVCIASHHSGLIDCLKPDGSNGFNVRMQKDDVRTHLAECKENADSQILERAKKLMDKPLLKAMLEQIRVMMMSGSKQSTTIREFYLGFWTRFLFSCLIDADRIDSADFETPGNACYRNKNDLQLTVAIERLELFLAGFSNKPTESNTPIDGIRREISEVCKNRAHEPQGIYTLTVPTGGGKTYASLRYALHHAQKHKLERIIYVIPYTSIIEQNAAAIRSALERESDAYPWVLEQHSNLEPERQTWHSKLAAENWDAPIVLTTMVQFLETLFGGGTRGVRRLHQLANSVVIFDEIQTLPIQCTHLFCNALNFLADHAGMTAVLCTATQPVLDRLRASDKGQLSLPQNSELMPDISGLFDQLKRVVISDKTKPEGWSEDEIAELALTELDTKGNCLVIVNTKAWAQALYLKCAETVDIESLFHLSTGQCAAHRKALFKLMRQRLADGLPVLCISTQLIEAGVDIDFAGVVRFLAGLDSIAQAAGRCNRNGHLSTATVHIVNPARETISQLIDIKVGQEKTKRVLSEIEDEDLLSPEAMRRYFQYYFYDRADDMSYPLSAKQVGRDDSLLNLLSQNKYNVGVGAALHLKQSFMTAGNVFKAIDAPTHSVIVPYLEGKQLLVELGGIAKRFEARRFRECLQRAQQYSVNVFPNVWRRLVEQQAVYEIQPGEGIYGLDERYYSEAFGLSTEPVSKAEAIIL
ncbi:CRISPR-associated helicase Cas3 domain protein [Methylotuvimicrobium alcaliphilum 20Z]|uniref:CRISPR-associated helicase Cas3 domain protein n=1 Tax=Methylotuvimicrobium alcaliphilum (strain DSM 19304 / NCIMB 14124 / VKM B-2133 / 20Z) TaxID=1091494 RepID=G4ST95_META2|nr:CRISPR-associated helicase Cas3 domain protein [Methylotuvimicrobium alcaliphilum 20Z]